MDENLYLNFQNPKPEASGKYKCRGLLQNSESLESEIQVNIYGNQIKSYQMVIIVIVTNKHINHRGCHLGSLS